MRAELALAADAPVPLVVEVAFAASAFPSGAAAFAATKTVWLGETADHPVLDTAEVDGVEAAPRQQLVVARSVDVALSVPFGETDDANWLTSCGSMHDYDLPQATLRVEPEDAAEGALAVVVRTPLGGVAWQIWSIRAE